MTEPLRAISVLRDDANYFEITDCPERTMRFLSRAAGKELADLIEHQQAEIKRLTDANEAFTGAGLRYEDEIARLNATIGRLTRERDAAVDAVGQIADNGLLCLYCADADECSDDEKQVAATTGGCGMFEYKRCVENDGEKSATDGDRGLYVKYNVVKADTGETVYDCFVLRPDRDPAAVNALRAYADATQNKALASDIIKWIGAENGSDNNTEGECKNG